MGESVPNNRECWIPKHSRGVLNAENLSKSDRSSGERYTPALAIPTAKVEKVRSLLREAWDDTTNPGIEAAIEEALALLEPRQ